MLSNTLSRALTIAAAAAVALMLAACAPTASPSDKPKPAASDSSTADGDCAGVTVIVDTGDLDVADDPSTTACVETAEAIDGADALAAVDLTTVGTTTYADAVCRVNGVPSETTELPGPDGGAYFETCADMPAASAYWSLWVKPAGGEWDYAQTGISGLELHPGDSVELLFTVNGEPAAPVS